MNTATQTLAVALLRAQEREREHIAGVLHGELGGLLSAASMALGQLQAGCAAGDTTLGAQIASVEGLLAQAMAVQRQLLEQLRPALLDHFGLPLTLRARFQPVCAGAGLHLDADLPETLALDKAAALALYRVADLALANILAHARATRVGLRLHRQEGLVRLQVSDDGVGCDPAVVARAGGVGLPEMRARLQAFGGTLELDGAREGGTVVVAKLPCP